MNHTPAKRRFARILKKLALTVLIVTAIALPVRQCIALPVRVPTDNVAPELPKGCRALVYRLASHFQPGDIVAYQSESQLMAARFVSATGDSVNVARNNESSTIPRGSIVGRIVLVTR